MFATDDVWGPKGPDFVSSVWVVEGPFLWWGLGLMEGETISLSVEPVVPPLTESIAILPVETAVARSAGPAVGPPGRISTAPIAERLVGVTVGYASVLSRLMKTPPNFFVKVLYHGNLSLRLGVIWAMQSDVW